jgi:hypothetical protein
VEGTRSPKANRTAKNKSDELLEHLFIATLSVTLLIALALGWRESGVVLLAIPATLALTLAIFYFYGYTLNRVTLFALKSTGRTNPSARARSPAPTAERELICSRLVNYCSPISFECLPPFAAGTVDVTQVTRGSVSCHCG